MQHQFRWSTGGSAFVPPSSTRQPSWPAPSTSPASCKNWQGKEEWRPTGKASPHRDTRSETRRKTKLDSYEKELNRGFKRSKSDFLLFSSPGRSAMRCCVSWLMTAPAPGGNSHPQQCCTGREAGNPVDPNSQKRRRQTMEKVLREAWLAAGP